MIVRGRLVEPTDLLLRFPVHLRGFVPCGGYRVHNGLYGCPYRSCHALSPGDHRVYDRLAKDRGCQSFHHGSDAGDYLLNLAADGGQHAPQAFGAQLIPVHKADRAVASEQIGIEGLGNQQIGGIDVLLPKPPHSRLILPCAQVEHAGGGIVCFCVVGETADLHAAHLLAIGGVGEGLHLHTDIRQIRGNRFTCNRYVHSLRHGPAAVIDVAGLAVRCVCRNPLQAIGIGRRGGSPVGVCGRFGNHLIVFLRQVVQVFRRRPVQSGRHVRVGLALRRLHDLRQARNVPPQQLFQRGAVRVAGFALALPHAVRVIRERLTVPVVAHVFRQLVQRVVGIAVRQLAVAPAGQGFLHHAAVLAIGVAEGHFASAADGLLKQIANAVIAV